MPGRVYDGRGRAFHAQPDPGYKFLGWNMGHCAGVGQCYVPWSDTDNSNNPDSTVGVEADFAPINPTPQTATYTYNAMGQRVTKTVNGVTTIYVYDIYGQLISEGASVLNPNTQEYEYQPLREYIYFDGQVIAHVEGSGGDYDGLHYVLNDHLGRPMQVLRDPTDANNPGETLWAMETEAFGEETGTFQKAGFSHNQRFSGQYYDQETGLSYNYYRDYDPSIGRYIQPDPIGLKGGMNLYGYVGGNPVVHIDVYGLTKISFNPPAGTLTVDPEVAGRAPYVLPASSGKANCDCDETKKNAGPIPKGDYLLDNGQLSNPGLLGDIVRNLRGDWGDWRAPLTPLPETNTHGRSGFFLHGGSLSGSAGCIDVGGGILGNDLTDQLLSDIMNDPDGIVPVTVK